MEIHTTLDSRGPSRGAPVEAGAGSTVARTAAVAPLVWILALGLGWAGLRSAPAQAASAPLSAEDDGWAGLDFGPDAFDEVVSLATTQHLRAERPAASWVAAAQGALRALPAAPHLYPRAFVLQERLSQEGRAAMAGTLTALKCAARSRPDVALLWPPARARRPAPTLSSELRARRLARTQRRRRAAQSWQNLVFDRDDFLCVMEVVQRHLGSASTQAVGLPAQSTAAVERSRQAWRIAASFFLKSFDPHCDVIPDRRFAELEARAQAVKLVGVGLSFGLQGKVVRVRRVHPEGPGAATVREGDQLLSVQGRPVAGLTLTQIDQLLQGAVGSQVKLQVKRKGRRHGLTLTRAEVKVVTVTGYLTGPTREVGVLRLPQFGSGDAALLAAEIQALQRESQGSLKALVLDMRGNGGGWVKEALGVADRFLSAGLITTVHGRDTPPEVHRASADPSDVALPLVVLVDGGCRSSCELVAAALRDNQRALVLGQTTFGKGSVQGVFEASRGPWSVLLTIARYHGPDGRSLQAEGVVPDVELAVMRAAWQGRRESDFDHHLEASHLAPQSRSRLLTPALQACARQRLSKWVGKARLSSDAQALREAAAHALCLPAGGARPAPTSAR